MLYIQKGSCPADIAEKIDKIKSSELWKNAQDPADDSLSKEEKAHASQVLRTHFDQLNKNRVRTVLLAEQHCLCAYCMLPIVNDGNSTTIEHWAPLSKKKSNALDYQNFLATCKGGATREFTNKELRSLTICCDAKKGDEASLIIDPRDESMMKGIVYSRNGIISYIGTLSAEIERDLDTVLCLNGKLDKDRNPIGDTRTQLVYNRRRVYQNTEQICLDQLERDNLTEEWLQAQISESLNKEQWDSMVGVSIYVYQLYLSRISKKNSRV